MIQTDWLTCSAEHARRRADDGHAWTARTIAMLKSWAAGRGEFLAERFIRAGLVTEPPDPHAWGGVSRDAARSGVIVRAGFARAETSNGSFKPTWRLAS